MFGRKTRAERLKEQAEGTSLVPMASLAAAYTGVRPIVERLLYDDDLRDNIRTLVESTRKIRNEVSDVWLPPASSISRPAQDRRRRR